ncbi:MAG: ATP-binding cassette domain-containing protein [Mycobacteriales bacterium]
MTPGVPGAPGSALVAVQGVARTYRRSRGSLFGPAATVPAVRGVSFSVPAGARFGIVGESGSGKSTLLRIMAGLDRPTTGRVIVDGTEIAGGERALRGLRRTVQVVFQDPMGSLDPRMRVRDIIAEPLVAQGIPGSRARVDELLDAVGLSPNDAGRYPHQFSGGQRQRISIARALAPRPKVLLADEPVSALDVSVRSQVLNLLADLVADFDLTLVFVSHDLSVIRRVCETVAVMRDGLIVEQGGTEAIWADPREAYTRELVGSVPSLRRALAGDSRLTAARPATNPKEESP